MNQADEEGEVISSYTLQQAIEDGVLVPIFEDKWPQLSGGVPIVATDHVCGRINDQRLRRVWDDFVVWKRDVEPGLPEADRLFTTKVYGDTVWVIEDGTAFTIMYPEDY